ncbi:MAG: hypothetical protein KAJ19_00460 [Gammaproteobacteria bacterium]|nr:hypothetical protein [Gammaproteobacteria bacterium]
MDKAKVNAAWEEYKGECVHEWEQESEGDMFKCTKCSDEASPTASSVSVKKRSGPPDHTTNDAVFKECVVKLWDAGIVQNVTTFASHPDPQIAAMIAVLKMEGIEIE